MVAGDLRAGGRFVFVDLGLKDFYPAYLADNLGRSTLSGSPVAARAIELQPPRGGETDAGIGFARRFEQSSFRDALVRELAARVEPDERVGFPAVLGIQNAGDVWRELETRLERPVFEVATLPPSVSGIRLFEAMTAALRQAGSRILLGPAVIGAETANGRVESVVAEAAARPTAYRAHCSCWPPAAGRRRNQVDSYGKIREAVLDLALGCRRPTGGRHSSDLPGGAAARPRRGAGRRPAPSHRCRRTYPIREPPRGGGHTAGAAPWREASGNGLSLARAAAAGAILESTS